MKKFLLITMAIAGIVKLSTWGAQLGNAALGEKGLADDSGVLKAINITGSVSKWILIPCTVVYVPLKGYGIYKSIAAPEVVETLTENLAEAGGEHLQDLGAESLGAITENFGNIAS